MTSEVASAPNTEEVTQHQEEKGQLEGAEAASKSGKGQEEGEKAKQQQDGLYIQDVGFSVHISVPGLEQFSIQVL